MSYTPPTLKNITPEEKILFACTRQNLLPEHRQSVVEACHCRPVDWEWVFGTAKLHGVAPLIYTNLRRCKEHVDIPPGVLKRFRLALMHNTLTTENIAKNLDRALDFFHERSIEVMLIKGGALDILVYDRPFFTTINDVDLVLSVSRRYVSDEAFDEFMAYFDGRGIEYDFYEHHDVNMNGVLPVDFRQIWQDAEKIEVGGRPALAMSPEDMLISLCINSCRKRYFRLKALCDIAETVHKYQNLRWSELVAKARRYDCHLIVYTALLVTSMTLGCTIPAEVFVNLKVGAARAKIIHFLSRRMSLSAYTGLATGQKKKLFGRNIDVALLLSYATFRGYQIWRRIKFAYLYTERGTRRQGFWPLTLPGAGG